MKIAIAAGGRFHALHLAHQLEKHGYLNRLFTASYTYRDTHYVSPSYVRQYRLGAYLDTIFAKLRLSRLINLSSWYVFKDNLFDRWVARQLTNSPDLDIFVGWAHYVLHSMPAIKKTGARIVLECGSMHILEQERLLKDEYQTYGVQHISMSAANIDKTLREYDATDYIMVPARHVFDSFIKHGISQEKLRYVPYGVDLSRFFPAEQKSKKFILLFVGNVSLGKGVQYLLQAWEKLHLAHAELWIVGAIAFDFVSVFKQYEQCPTITFMGPVSQERLAQIYRKANLFVLPSLQEGIAMVQVEAMASGLPIIGTPNTGAAELIEDGVQGFICPIKNANALAERIAWFYDHQDAGRSMGMAAAAQAQTFSWDAYGEKVIKVYQSLLRK